MADITKRVVTSNATGAVVKWGRTDFTGQFDPADFTQHDLNDSAHWIPGVLKYNHKVVTGELVEMTTLEKAAADTEHQEIADDKLEGAAKIGKKFPNLAALPMPPPGAGYIVAIENVGGSWGLAYSTPTGYIIFQADGTYP